MSQRAEGARWAMAALGPLLLLVSSFMPLFGRAAKHRAGCAGRSFTGTFDDCFNDYLPILELTAPLIGAAFCWMFARFAFVLWAPPPDLRKRQWRLASAGPVKDYWPTLHIIASIGAVWATWRATTYLFAVELWPFVLFWAVFASWFAAGCVVAWPRRGDAQI